MSISVTESWTAHHAVANDPKNSEQHPHDWSVEVIVDGPLVGPGWVMDFAELRRIVRRVLPRGRTMNAWLCHDDATAERIAKALHDQVRRRLPAGVRMVRVVLEEGPGDRVQWPSDDQGADAQRNPALPGRGGR